MYNNSNGKDIKEGFCAACLTIPFAFAGIGVSAYGSNSRKSHKYRKKIAIIGFIISFISIIAGLYFYFKCSECR